LIKDSSVKAIWQENIHMLAQRPAPLPLGLEQAQASTQAEELRKIPKIKLIEKDNLI